MHLHFPKTDWRGPVKNLSTFVHKCTERERETALHKLHSIKKIKTEWSRNLWAELCEIYRSANRKLVLSVGKLLSDLRDLCECVLNHFDECVCLNIFSRIFRHVSWSVIASNMFGLFKIFPSLSLVLTDIIRVHREKSQPLHTLQ